MQHLHIREILAEEIMQIMPLQSRGTSYTVQEALLVMAIIVKDQVMVLIKNIGRQACLVIIWITDKV